MNESMSAQQSFGEFLDNSPKAQFKTYLSFKNVGDVKFTTVTSANLAMLSKARDQGRPGVVISCPDFERESLAIVFLSALNSLWATRGQLKKYEPKPGDVIVVGDCVAKIQQCNRHSVMLSGKGKKRDACTRSDLEGYQVHRPKADAQLSSFLRRGFKSRACDFSELPETQQELLASCGYVQQAVGYVSSHSQYLNEAPTFVADGEIRFSSKGKKIPLGECMPISYVRTNGTVQDRFAWPFENKPAVLVGPRYEGVGSAWPLIEVAKDKNQRLNFVSLDIPSQYYLETTLVGDIEALIQDSVGVVCFCDRKTFASREINVLREKGFLFFDWGSCECAQEAKACTLTMPQQNAMRSSTASLYPISQGDTHLSFAKEIIYGKLDSGMFFADEEGEALSNLYRSLGMTLRRTDVPAEDYCRHQQQIIDDSFETIEASGMMDDETCDELERACNVLKECNEPGAILPKEEKTYDLLSLHLDAEDDVVLVVGDGRVSEVRKYWIEELKYNKFDTTKLKVMSMLDFMAGKGLRGTEYAYISGWFDRGSMDRALHAGVTHAVTPLLYGDEKGGLEVEWWNKAVAYWAQVEKRCEADSIETLAMLGIDSPKWKEKTPKRTNITVSARGKSKDDSPDMMVAEINMARIRGDLASAGEKSTLAVPVMFDDGSYVWLKPGTGSHGRGGTLIVISDCLAGVNNEPERKPAANLLRGDVILRTYSDSAYIAEKAESRYSNYQRYRDIANGWFEPIKHARRQRLSDSAIAYKISQALPRPKTKAAIRRWVTGECIAPSSKEDIRAIYKAFGYPVTEEELDRIMRAARVIRGAHQGTGRLATMKLVKKFLEDVAECGDIEKAEREFDEKHRSGNVKLLAVTAVGALQHVATERVRVIGEEA